jgi:flagellar hook-associated protein 2
MASVSTISGVASGIDWQATVDALMKVEQQKVTLLENQQSAQQNRLAAWRTLNTRLLAFKTAMDSLEEAQDFQVNSAASSDAAKVAASAGSAAAPGAHSVEVDRLAQAARLVHQGWADADSSAVNDSGADQVFAYTYAGATISLAVADGSTLADLRDFINDDPDNPGVRASLVNDGSGGASAWHLVLSGADTGAEHTLAIDDILTTLGDGAAFDGAAFSQSQAAQNARFRLDGYPPAGWLESASNTVDEALEGVTLTLKGSTNEAVEINVSRDSAAVKAKIQGLVDSYNAVVGQINSYTSYDSGTQTMGVLLGDGGANQLKRQLAALVTRAQGTLPVDALYRSLGQVGVKSGAGGLLSIDGDKLDEALAAHPAQVEALFTFKTSSSDPAFSFFTRAAATIGGEVALSASYDAAGVLTGATLDGEPAVIAGNLISAGADSRFQGLRVLFTDPGDGPGTRSGTILLAHGVAAALTLELGGLTDSEDGLVQFQTERLQDTLERLAGSISDMNDRLAQKREQLTREYLAMETALARLQSQAQALGSLTGSSTSA